MGCTNTEEENQVLDDSSKVGSKLKCVKCGHGWVDRHGECRLCIDWQRHVCVFEDSLFEHLVSRMFRFFPEASRAEVISALLAMKDELRVWLGTPIVKST